MISARWLLSADGQAFMEAMARLAGGEVTGLPEGIDDRANPAAAFRRVLDAFAHGVRHDVPINAQTELALRHRIHAIYWFRFQTAVRDKAFDYSLCEKQAEMLGRLTAAVFRLHHDDLSFPGHDPSAALAVDHLDWARDVLGFLLWGNEVHANKVRWKPKIEIRDLVAQFEAGCSLC